jgi:AcrR family transcriptional regulator
MKDAAQRKLIIDTAFEKFRRFGLRRVSLGEIATDLRISKKTLYQHFASKEDLVRECLETRVVSQVIPKIAAALQREAPVAEHVVGMWQALSQVSRLVTPELMGDLKAEYPHLWEEIDRRRRVVIESIEALLVHGRQTGEVRPEVNPVVVVRILLAIAEKLLVPDVLFHAPFTPAEAIETLMTLLMRGAFVQAIEPPQEKQG